jgi:predicted SAM-dependent methyltransferase
LGGANTVACYPSYVTQINALSPVSNPICYLNISTPISTGVTRVLHYYVDLTQVIVPWLIDHPGMTAVLSLVGALSYPAYYESLGILAVEVLPWGHSVIEGDAHWASGWGLVRGEDSRFGNLMKKVGFLLPRPALMFLRAARDRVLGLWYRGLDRWCPVCQKPSRKFRTGGVVAREEARCPHCRAMERHRFVWLYFTHRTDLFDGQPKRVLHVAPEQCFNSRLQDRLGAGYLTADLLDPHVMERMDITSIHYPDEAFDVIYCSHVLEHVPDDLGAMREFHRVLKKGGWAVLLVPITADKTVEDPSIVDPSDRLRVFGQEDHVRNYGPDYVDRLRQAGFDVDITQVSDMIAADEAARMGISRAGAIYRCRRADHRAEANGRRPSTKEAVPLPHNS